MKRAMLALYGNVVMNRAWCEDCEQEALVVDGELACCGSLFSKDGELPTKRMSEPEFCRRGLPAKVRDAILQEQGFRCFWCDRVFGSAVMGKRGPSRLRIHWDHVTPFVLTFDNRASNYVASCQICNSLKGSRVFDTVEAVRVYIASVSPSS